MRLRSLFIAMPLPEPKSCSRLLFLSFSIFLDFLQGDVHIFKFRSSSPPFNFVHQKKSDKPTLSNLDCFVL
jgi:hypothetical protein